MESSLWSLRAAALLPERMIMSDAPPFPTDDDAPAQPPSLPEDKPRCVRCGSTDLGRGYILSNQPNFRPAYFAPKKFSPRRARRALRLSRNVVKIEGDVCRNCGYIMLCVNPKALEKVKKKFSAD
jgi:hypothetical protein